MGKFAASLDLDGDNLPRRRSSARPFRDGLLVQFTNPKALVYITAVLPPFIDAARPLGPQLAVLAGASIALDALSMIAYGFGGAALAARMAEPRFRRLFSAATALLLCAAALMILTRH